MNQETAFKKAIVLFLAESRKDIGQTASLLGVDPRTIAKWMNGDIIPHKLLQPYIIAVLQSEQDSANNKVT